MDLRILIAAGALILTGPILAQENVALGKPVFERDGPFGLLSDLPDPADPPGVWPGVVTDGHFQEPGDEWFLGSWWLDGLCIGPPWTPGGPPGPCALDIELHEEWVIDSFIFQGDSDAYLIQYRVDHPPWWETAWHVPSAAGGIQTRPNPLDNGERWILDEPIVTRRLRVRIDPDGPHDAQHAVSELQAFGRPFDPCVDNGGAFVDGACMSAERRIKTYVASGDRCYRFEIACKGFVNGGFGACVFPDGFFDFGMGAQVGDPGEFIPGDPECGFGGGHFLNDAVEHSCSFDNYGKVNFDVREVRMVHCLSEDRDSDDDDSSSDDD